MDKYFQVFNYTLAEFWNLFLESNLIKYTLITIYSVYIVYIVVSL